MLGEPWPAVPASEPMLTIEPPVPWAVMTLSAALSTR